MSRSLDLFIDTPIELPELARRLGQLTGAPLVAHTDGDRFVLSEGETVAVLGRHPFVDDGKLLLSRYTYALSSRVPAGEAVADSRELALLRHLAELIRQRMSMPALLVHDLQNRDRGATTPEPPPAAVPQ
jgi:hypothetical protein